MASLNKSEINLEISSGFFRISTEDVVYNITVLDGSESGATRVVKRIVEEEKRGSRSAAMEELADLEALSDDFKGDDYYKQVSTDLYHDIGQLAKSLSSTIMEIPAEDRHMKRAELDEAGEKIEDAKKQLKDIVSMTEQATMEIMDHVEKVQGQTDDVKKLLSFLKNHKAFQVQEESEAAEDAEPLTEEGLAEGIKNLRENVEKAGEIIKGLLEAGGDSSPQPAESEKKIEKKNRYLFALDTIFQTIYELCTNETVKGHIAAAREQAEDIFDKDIFVDELTQKVGGLEPDADNFYTVPLSDVLQPLLNACTENKIRNLLKKMDTNQGEIFLDQSIPLEVPPVEEVEIEVESGEAPPAEEERADDPRLVELAELMTGTLSLIEELAEKPAGMNAVEHPGMSLMTMADQQEIFDKIGSAFDFAANICDTVTKITEVLSFQDLSGQQIMKIIKLLSDFQIQLLAIVVSFGSQLKNKEMDAAITAEESRKLAQEDVDKYITSVTTEEVGGEGALDQASVNQLLEEMGF